jgi:hypothetical protein
VHSIAADGLRDEVSLVRRIGVPFGGRRAAARRSRKRAASEFSNSIQLSYYAGEAGSTVPYWYAGADAAAVVDKIYQLGRVVEDATGLAGFDPQVELPLAEAQPDLARAAFDQVAAMFARRGISSPSNRAG